MIEFIKNNKEIVWVSVVVLSTIALLILLRFSYRLLKGRFEKKKKDTALLKWLRNILKVYLYGQGVLLISYVFLEESMHKFVNDNLLKVFVIAFASIFIILGLGIIRLVFERLIIKATEDDERDPTPYKFLKYLSNTIVVLIGITIGSFAFPQLQTLAQTALAGAGILAVVVGVASQEAIANIVGGIFIIIYRPFKIGDVLKIRDDMVGHVEDITMRHTVIKNYQNKRIIVPNSIINKEKLINYDLGEKKTCQWIEIGISYEADINEAKRILENECLQHPHLIDNRDFLGIKNGDPKVIVRVIGLGDSSVNLRAWAWARDYPNAFVMKCEILESVKKQYDKAGIEIPFPQRTITIKNNNLKTHQVSE